MPTVLPGGKADKLQDRLQRYIFGCPTDGGTQTFLSGAAVKLENAHFPLEGHDYGLNKRKAVYAFLAKHLKMDVSKIQNSANEIDESFITTQPYKQLTVFDDEFARPSTAAMGNEQVMNLFTVK